VEEEAAQGSVTVVTDSWLPCIGSHSRGCKKKRDCTMKIKRKRRIGAIFARGRRRS